MPYGLKSKDDAMKALRTWYSDIADWYSDMMQVLESREIYRHFSTPKEQWKNSVAELTINCIMIIARTVMAESGQWGRFWFKAALAGKDARNVTFKERIGMTPHQPCMVRNGTCQISENSAVELGYI
jgi:hypothetical protein